MKEFKEFALKGNVMDMAIGVIIGGAFGTIVKSLVGVVFIYGYNLVSAILRGMGDSKHPFIFIALAVFMLVKAMNKAKKKEEEAPAAPPEPTKEEVLLTEIRDALVNK